jgi:hypothetical protein
MLWRRRVEHQPRFRIHRACREAVASKPLLPFQVGVPPQSRASAPLPVHGTRDVKLAHATSIIGEIPTEKSPTASQRACGNRFVSFRDSVVASSNSCSIICFEYLEFGRQSSTTIESKKELCIALRLAQSNNHSGSSASSSVSLK